MAVGEGSTGAGLQVAFKFGGLFSSREGGVAAERPGAEFRSVWNAAFVVFCQADLEIAGQADVALVWLRLALKKVDVMHGDALLRPKGLRRAAFVKALACQPEPWRRLVEAAGVEPASEKVPRKETTCVSGSVVFVRPMRNRQEGGGLARLISVCGFEQEPWTYPAKMTSLDQRAGSLTQNGDLIN